MVEPYNKVLLNLVSRYQKISETQDVFNHRARMCALWLLKENGLTILRINKKKFIYLISPNKITKNFYQMLKEVLKSGKISFFQMRFKKYSFKKKILIGKKLDNYVKIIM